MIGNNVIRYIIKNFKRNDRPSSGKNKIFGTPNSLCARYEDSFLVDSGIFIKSGLGVQFTSEFIDQVYKEYPAVSIESKLKSYGLTPEKVCYQRIYSLKNVLKT